MEETFESQLPESSQVPPEEPTPDQGMTDAQFQAFQTDQQFRRGVSWFYWIAGLSLVNSVIWLTGSEWSFIVGLGATQLVDGLFIAIIEDTQVTEAIKFAAFGIDLLIAGLYVLIGFLGLKRFKAIIIMGMVFYALDGLFFLLVGDFLSIAFHGYALFCIFGGLKALNQLKQLESVQHADFDAIQGA